MTAASLYALSGVALFGIGFYAVVVHVHRLRKVLAVNVMGSGVFLVLVALAYRTPNALSDPVPHAMVLTGVVVAVSATAVQSTSRKRADQNRIRTCAGGLLAIVAFFMGRIERAVSVE